MTCHRGRAICAHRRFLANKCNHIIYIGHIDGYKAALAYIVIDIMQDFGRP
jgi:hypothetical protein